MSQQPRHKGPVLLRVGAWGDRDTQGAPAASREGQEENQQLTGKFSRMDEDVDSAWLHLQHTGANWSLVSSPGSLG